MFRVGEPSWRTRQWASVTYLGAGTTMAPNTLRVSRREPHLTDRPTVTLCPLIQRSSSMLPLAPFPTPFRYKITLDLIRHSCCAAADLYSRVVCLHRVQRYSERGTKCKK